MPAIARLGSFWSSKGTISILYLVPPISTPPSSFSQAARVSIERWLEIPQAAAGPDVTPTKPIFSLAFSAQAAVPAAQSRANCDTKLFTYFKKLGNKYGDTWIVA